MSESPEAPPAAGPRQRTVEMGVALAIAAFGAIVIWGAVQAGTGWGAEGPKSGFFPFWVGVIIVATSIMNFTNALLVNRGSIRKFAEWRQMGQVLRVVVPLAAYVAVMPWIGLYLASALLIAGFMRWVGRYNWLLTLVISVAVPVVAYITFENWFLVALPKGPIEDWLGL
jgi:putative tricarboxylic transport membrane protein